VKVNPEQLSLEHGYSEGKLMKQLRVPFFKPDIGEAEVAEVAATVRSGWLTTGPRVRRFEKEFGAAVGAPHAIAVNSCTGALHLALEAVGLRPGQAVLVPTMTFAATAAVVHHLGGVPLLVDCDPATGNVDLDDAEQKLTRLRAGRLPAPFARDIVVVGLIPVHVGGLMLSPQEILDFAKKHKLWVVEDAAHAFPAAWRRGPQEPWQRCGENTAAVTCFSFYANKTITTGEGGMAVTADPALADRMRSMSLHGLSHDAWERYSGGGSWDYQILAPGYKYNMTDLAAAIGIHQLARAGEMRRRRELIAAQYIEALAKVEELETPSALHANRIHAWHLFPIRLQTERLAIDRNGFIDELRRAGVGYSVHWRPLHLHPYYRETYHWAHEDCPNASALWERSISLPLFPGMREDQVSLVIDCVRDLCARYRR
jgi:perosamine synthetase